MKLRRLLKAVLPIATVSTVVPFVAACHKSSYSFNYGDNINCLNENADNYHSLDDVKDAVYDKVDKDSPAQFDDAERMKTAVDGVNATLVNSEMKMQNFYFDLIAGCTRLESKPLLIVKWEMKLIDAKYTIGFETLAFSNDVKYESKSGLVPMYGYDTETKSVCVYINAIDNDHKVCKSYTYQDWTVKGA